MSDPPEPGPSGEQDSLHAMIRRALGWWHAETATLSDERVTQLLAEREQVWRWLRAALRYDDLVVPAARLMANLFKVIDRSNDWRDWCHLLEQAVALLPAREVQLRVNLENHRGFFWRRGRDHRAGLAIHRAALAAAQQHGLRQEAAEAEYYSAVALMELGELAAAQAALERALAVFQTFDPPPPYKLGAIYNVLGQVQSRIEAFAEAEQNLHNALANFIAIREYVYAAKVYANLANLLMFQDKFAAAVQACKDGLALLQEQPSTPDEMRLRNTRGVIEIMRKVYPEAEPHFLAVLDLGRQPDGDSYFHALATLNIGIARFWQNRLDDAQPFLLEGMRLFNVTNDTYDRGNAWGMVGLLRKQQGKLQEASTYLHKSIRELESAPWHTQARRELAMYRAALGEVERDAVPNGG